jgi:DNA-binding CsgD family transcriptional regulator
VSKETDHATIDALSRREIEVLRLAALGLTNTEVAKRLGVTVHAVKFHLASVYRKLGAGNRTEAVVVFLQNSAAAARSPGLEVND